MGANVPSQWDIGLDVSVSPCQGNRRLICYCVTSRNTEDLLYIKPTKQFAPTNKVRFCNEYLLLKKAVLNYKVVQYKS